MTTSQSMNRTFGGSYHTVAGGTLNANSGPGEGKAGPNASVTAEVQTNDGSVKGSIGAQASATQYDDEKQDLHVNVGQVKVGAEGEAGRGGLHGEIAARARLVDIDSRYGGAGLGVGASTEAGVGPGGVEFKVAGTGVAVGADKLGISVFDNEVFIRPGNIVKDVWKSLFG